MTTKAQTAMTWRQLAARGGAGGIVLAYAYALVFLVYAVVRLAAAMITTLDPADLAQTLFLQVMSLILAVLSFAAIMALVAGLLGSISALIALGLSRWMAYKHALSSTAVIVALIINGWGFALGGTRLVTLYLATYLFWIGVPTLIYLGYAVVAGRYLERHDLIAEPKRVPALTSSDRVSSP